MSSGTEIKKLDSHHLKMIEREVFEGATLRELAEEFTLNSSYLSQLRQSEPWKLKSQELRAELKEQHLTEITQLRGPAIKALKDGVHEDEDIQIRVKTAKEILDRTGFSSGQDLNKQGSPIFHLYLPEHRRPKEEANPVIEVEIEETKDEETSG